jgi:hypothetical protein
MHSNLQIWGTHNLLPLPQKLMNIKCRTTFKQTQLTKMAYHITECIMTAGTTKCYTLNFKILHNWSRTSYLFLLPSYIPYGSRLPQCCLQILISFFIWTRSKLCIKYILLWLHLKKSSTLCYSKQHHSYKIYKCNKGLKSRIFCSWFSKHHLIHFL